MKYKDHNIVRTSTTTTVYILKQRGIGHYPAIRYLYRIEGVHGKLGIERPYITTIKAAKEFITEAIATTYKIIRFRPNEDHNIIKTGLTLAEAQTHCRDPKTMEEGVFFDGYDVETRGVSDESAV